MAKKTKSIKQVLENTVKEIASGVTIEKLSPQYFNLEALLKQPAPIYRLDSANNRYYYRFDEAGEPTFYTSVTTLIKNTLPTSPHLIKWIADKGADEGHEEAMERAFYGTFLHNLCGQLLITGKLDLDTVSSQLQDFATKERRQVKDGWVEDLKKDVLCFAQFMIDRDVKPLAVELILYHPTDGYAGAIDLVYSMEFYKKRINCIIDLKSGKKGFYESHEIQLRAYKDMFNIHFPDVPIDRIFNWSPKDFKGITPTYNLKDQTDSRNIVKLPHLVELAKIEDAKRTNTLTLISGKIDVTKGLSKNIVEKTFIELVKENK
jgi:hypothetical protein